MILNRSKWHFRKENLIPGDIIYFKLTESKMSATWRLGKVEDVKIGKDGYVRKVIVSYKDTVGDDPSDWTCRSVERPVRNIVKLFHIDETSFLEDIMNIYSLSSEILEKQKVSYEESDEKVVNNFENDKVKSVPLNSQKKKRLSEIEKLKIEMKGWSNIYRVSIVFKDVPRTFEEDYQVAVEVMKEIQMNPSSSFYLTQAVQFSKCSATDYSYEDQNLMSFNIVKRTEEDETMKETSTSEDEGDRNRLYSETIETTDDIINAIDNHDNSLFDDMHDQYLYLL